MKWTDFNIPITLLVSNPELIIDRLLRIVIGLFGSLFWISLFAGLFTRNGNVHVRKLAKYGKYTIGVYILQTYILEYGLCKIISLDRFSFLVSDFILSPIISLIVLVLCFSIIIITERYMLISQFLWGYINK